MSENDVRLCECGHDNGLHGTMRQGTWACNVRTCSCGEFDQVPAPRADEGAERPKPHLLHGVFDGDGLTRFRLECPYEVKGVLPTGRRCWSLDDDGEIDSLQCFAKGWVDECGAELISFEITDPSFPIEVDVELDGPLQTPNLTLHVRPASSGDAGAPTAEDGSDICSIVWCGHRRDDHSPSKRFCCAGDCQCGAFTEPVVVRKAHEVPPAASSPVPEEGPPSEAMVLVPRQLLHDAQTAITTTTWPQEARDLPARSDLAVAMNGHRAKAKHHTPRGLYAKPRQINQCVRSNGRPKLAYPDEYEAQGAAEALTRDKGYGERKWEPYLCPTCEWWHIGQGRTALNAGRAEGIRWTMVWQPELGERVAALMRAENDPRRSGLRLKHLHKLFKSTDRVRRRSTQSPTDPPESS